MRTADSVEFREFLDFVGKSGYADSKAPITQLEDGSHNLVLENNGFRFHDNWFGGEPYGGREVISKDGKVFWMMVYYGEIKQDAGTPAEVYGITLKEALRQPDTELPVRGPKVFKASNGCTYSFEWTGNLDRFTGEEMIKDPKGKVVYTAEMSGGLVDL